MIIRRLTASFGRLQNETLTLDSGLNIIEAPNECGKSTWCAFIKALLYGIRTSDRDKAGYLSDKTRYRPWSGVPMAGSMEIETGGAAVTLERKTDGKLPMKDFTAFYTGTGSPYPALSPDSAGELLLGISEAVFERSAYMSQAGIKVTQTPELEKRIAALVTTGDEGISFSEIDERLRTWLRKRRFNKSGTIPALEERIAEYGRSLGRIQSAVDESAAMRLETERLDKKRLELISELEACDLYESRQASRRAAEKLAAAKARYDAVYAELSKTGPAPDEKTVAAIRGELKSLETLYAMEAAERKILENYRANLDILEEERRKNPFGSGDAAHLTGQAESLESEIKKLAFSGLPAVVTMVITLLAAAAAVYAGAAAAGMPLLLPVTAAAAALGLILLVWRAFRLKNRRDDLKRLLSRYNAGSVGGLNALIAQYAVLAASVRDAENDVRSSEKSAAAAAAMVETARHSLTEKLSSYAIGGDRLGINRELDRIESLLEKLSAAKAEIQAAESYLKTIREADTAAGSDSEPPPAPTRSRQEIAAELQAVTGRHEDLTRRYNIALGEIRALGDPVILGSEKIAAEALLDEHRAQYDALSLAVEALKDANSELQSRFSPLLSETAGRIIGRLTGGRYEKLTFDKTLDAFAKTTDEAVSRNILALSAGTADQIYLALRLAVCELVLPAENPCPLILDDALTNFDDRRAGLALSYLAELAEKRQILLFTCHGREAAFFERGGANLIKLF